MSTHRWIWRSIPMAAAAVAGAATLAAAQWNQPQGQALFEWSGRVDREVQIVMRGNRVWTNDIGATEPRGDRSRTLSSLPRQDGQVFVQLLNGRGDVAVIQQPSARNGYATVVRIRDPRGGSDDYRLAAYYQGYGSNGGVYGSNGGVYGSNGDVLGHGNGHGNSRAAERSHGQRGAEMRRRNGHDDEDDDDRGDRGGVNRNGGGVYGNGGGVYGNGGGVYGNGGGVYGNGGGVYGNSLLHWSGNVDDELEIRMQNGRIEYRTVRGAQPTSIRVNGAGAQMPRSNAALSVIQHQGRGSVSVVQQPSAWNGYTTVIRVRDPQGGYGFYDFDLVWQ